MKSINKERQVFGIHVITREIEQFSEMRSKVLVVPYIRTKTRCTIPQGVLDILHAADPNKEWREMIEVEMAFKEVHEISVNHSKLQKLIVINWKILNKIIKHCPNGHLNLLHDISQSLLFSIVSYESVSIFPFVGIYKHQFIGAYLFILLNWIGSHASNTVLKQIEIFIAFRPIFYVFDILVPFIQQVPIVNFRLDNTRPNALIFWFGSNNQPMKHIRIANNLHKEKQEDIELNFKQQNQNFNFASVLFEFANEDELETAYQHYFYDTFKCAYCGGVSLNPLVTSCTCQNIVCSMCSSKQTVCTMCRKHTDYCKHPFVEAIVDDIPVRCECGSLIAMKDIKKHKMLCQFKDCPQCSVKLRADEIITHMKSQHLRKLLTYFSK